MVGRFLLLPALAAGMLGAAAYGEDSLPLTEDLFLGDIPQVLGATRLRQPLSETPAAVTIIDRQMIRASGALDIPDVLRLVPGFQVGHVNGAQTTVTYHGFSDAYARRMQVLVDGRSVYNPFFGGVIWTDLALAIDDIERIEVIRGPNGVTYGANSFSAVINIITRDPADTQGAYLRYTGGAIGTHATVARYSGGDTDSRYRGTVSYRGDDGFPNEEDGKQVRLATFRQDTHLNRRDSLTFQLGYNGGTRDDGTSQSTTDPARKVQIVTNFQQLAWKHELSAEGELGLQFYHDYYRRADTFWSSAGPVHAIIDLDVFVERYDLEFSHTLKPQADTRVVWGAELRRDQVGGPGWFGTDQMLDYPLYRLFGNTEWRFRPDWILNAGAMYEHNDVTGGDVSPRLALNYHVVPGQTLRTSVTRAYRTPAAFEDRADAIIHTNFGDDHTHQGNPSLKPERITAYEVGYLGEFPKLGTVVDLKLFKEEIRDIVTSGNDKVTTPADAFERYVNDGESTTNGAELQLTYRMAPGTRAVFAYSYAHQYGRLVKQVAPTTYMDTRELTPIHTRSLFLEHRLLRNTEVSLAYYQVDHFTFMSPGDPTEYKSLDMRVAQKLRFGNTRGEIAFVGQHMLGDYFDFDRLIVFDKRFFLTLSLEVR